MCAGFQFLCSQRVEKKCLKQDLQEDLILSAACVARIEALYVHLNFLRVLICQS
jgi:hypothetical protein